MKSFSSREIAVAAALAAFSATVQLIHVGYQSPAWGMWIDIVSVSWLIAFFLYGARVSFAVSVLGALIITFFAPDTWLGAIMKWAATLPMWLTPYLWIKYKKKNPGYYSDPVKILPPLVVALIVRSVIVLPINYYFALPIWTKMTTIQAWNAIPWYIIVLFNSVQGILDVVLAWFIVFRFKINRYAAWN